MRLSEKLRELREQAELSQAQLADTSGIPLWTLRGYEQGRREPLWEVLFRLADALGVSVEEFRECITREKRPAPGKANRGTASSDRRSQARSASGSRRPAGPHAPRKSRSVGRRQPSRRQARAR